MICDSYKHIFYVTDRKKVRKKSRSINSSSTSESSKISAQDLQLVVDRLLCNQYRSSTAKTYFSVWRQFNTFVIKLDIKPPTWEERTTLFVASLIDRGVQSSSVKSYVSAIKKMLTDDGYIWDDRKFC